jgi:hypothetical protein
VEVSRTPDDQRMHARGDDCVAHMGWLLLRHLPKLRELGVDHLEEVVLM